jgi:sortase A
MRQPRTWRLLATAIPILVFVVGAGAFAFNGWDYAKQTFLRTNEHLTVYHPATHANTEKPAAGRKNSSVVRDRKMALWPTLPVPGTKIGELTFPSIDLSVPIVQGSDADVLKLGAGHVMSTPLPGQGGNVLLSGHRDTVFAKLQNLKPGDRVVLSTPYGDFVYEMTSTKIVSENDLTAVAPTDYETLTLTTCYPFYYIGSAPERYIVSTKLVAEPKALAGIG